MQLRFCPSCGGNLPQVSTIKYCPYCGENLARLTVAEPGPAESAAAPAADPAGKDGAEDKGKTLADVALTYDRFIADLRSQGLDEAEIRRQAAGLFAGLKGQLPVRPAVFAAGRSTAGEKQPAVLQAGNHYSVVLKSSGDKERLTRRLSEVLRRSLTATRMAVEMVPGIIIYKSKESDIQAALAILEEEQLHYSVLKGDFATDVPVEKLVPGFFALAGEVQQLLRNTSPSLWLGERVYVVAPKIEVEDEPATLAVTDQALYIFRGFMAEPRPQWRIIPYSRLEEVVLHGGRRGGLELVYKESVPDTWLNIADETVLDEVYEHIRLALGQAR